MATVDASNISSGMAALLSAVEMESNKSSAVDARQTQNASEGNALVSMSKTEANDAPKPNSVPASKPSLKKRWLEREESNRSNTTEDTEITDDGCSTSCASSIALSSSAATLSDPVICDTSKSRRDQTSISRARGSVMDDGRSYEQECDDAKSSSYLSNRPIKKRRHFMNNVPGDVTSSIASDDQKLESGEAGASSTSDQTPQQASDDQQALLTQQALLSKVRRQASSRIAASLQLGRALSLSSSSSSSSSDSTSQPPTTTTSNPSMSAPSGLPLVSSHHRHWAPSSAAARSRRALRAHYAQDAAQLLAGVENMHVSSSTLVSASSPMAATANTNAQHGAISSSSSPSTSAMAGPTATMAPTPASTTITTTAPIVQSLTSHYELNRHTSNVVSSAIEALQKSQSIHFAANPIAPMPQLDAVLRRRRMSLDAVSTTSRTRLAVEAGIVVGTNKNAATAAIVMQQGNAAANVSLDRPATIAGISIPYYLQRVTAGGASLQMM